MQHAFEKRKHRYQVSGYSGSKYPMNLPVVDVYSVSRAQVTSEPSGHFCCASWSSSPAKFNDALKLSRDHKHSNSKFAYITRLVSLSSRVIRLFLRRVPFKLLVFFMVPSSAFVSVLEQFHIGLAGSLF